PDSICVSGVAAPPVANFRSDKTTLCANDCINFIDLSSNATAWEWTFAGATNSTSAAQNPQGVCSTPGTYDVMLIVSNSGGTDSITITNYITVIAAPPPPVGI